MSDLTPQSSWSRNAMSFDTNGGFLTAMRKEIDHIFDEFGGSQSNGGNATHCVAPRMNCSEMENSVEIDVELPGVDEKDLDIALNEDVLTIKGEKRMQHDEQHRDYYRQERAFGRFTRSITLPFEPDPKTVKTLFAKGVLTITLPKSATVKQQTIRIPVKASV
ncbi:MAG: Hsp20/alpha crystallin family protein [Rhizomicrobium sp.]